MAFIRPVAKGLPITRQFGEAGPHFTWHIDEQTGLFTPGQLCGNCKKLAPCSCLNPEPYGNHKGIDFGCREGTEVVAMAGGMIIRTGFEDDENNGHATGPRIVQLVMMLGYDSWIILYRNLREILVQPGAKVRAGDRLGYSGYLGMGTPFIHVELVNHRRKLQPFQVLDE